MIQGFGIANKPADSYGAAAANYHRKGGVGAEEHASKKPAKHDEVIFSSAAGSPLANETVRESDEAKQQKHDEIAKSVRDEYQRLQANVIRTLLQGTGFQVSEGMTTDDMLNAIFDIEIPESEQGMTAEEIIELLPDDWKPDAVAERIVNFATSFYGASGLSGEEFLEKITEAINVGFGEADKQLNGRLPANIQQVIQFTRDAVAERLERWAEATGVRVPERVDITA